MMTTASLSLLFSNVQNGWLVTEMGPAKAKDWEINSLYLFNFCNMQNRRLRGASLELTN